MVEPSPQGEIFEMDIGRYLKFLLLKRLNGFLTLILNAALTALGGHELLEVAFVCDLPLQVLHLCVVLAEVLQCFLPQQDHLGLGFGPELQPAHICSQCSGFHITALVSNLTCHYKQQWNDSQIPRSFCGGHRVPIYVYIYVELYIRVKKRATKTHV